MKFTKMQGAGNDFILIEGNQSEKIDYSSLAQKICDRHFGIGADGLMIAEASSVADSKMLYYNSDGSQAAMCGNGIRCFSRFVYENEIVKKPSFTIETLAGNKKINIINCKNDSFVIQVNMGKAQIDHLKSLNHPEDSLIDTEVLIESELIKVTYILMGVPHVVIFVDKIDKDYILDMGPKIENANYFNENTNVNFVRVIDHQSIEVETWERGAGYTLACGTGCCASSYAACLIKDTSPTLQVKAAGGVLEIDIQEDIIMTGEADLICVGEYYL